MQQERQVWLWNWWQWFIQIQCTGRPWFTKLICFISMLSFFQTNVTSRSSFITGDKMIRCRKSLTKVKTLASFFFWHCYITFLLLGTPARSIYCLYIVFFFWIYWNFPICSFPRFGNPEPGSCQCQVPRSWSSMTFWILLVRWDPTPPTVSSASFDPRTSTSRVRRFTNLAQILSSCFRH